MTYGIFKSSKFDKEIRALNCQRIIIASATRLERNILLSKMSPYISMLGRVP